MTTSLETAPHGLSGKTELGMDTVRDPQTERVVNIIGVPIKTSADLEHVPDVEDFVVYAHGKDANNEATMWRVAGYGTTPEGQPVKIIDKGTRDYDLLPLTDKEIAARAEVKVEPEQLPTEVPQKQGRGVMDVLRGIIRHKEEAHGADPEAVPLPGRITVLDAYGGKHRTITTSPDHLNGNGQ